MRLDPGGRPRLEVQRWDASTAPEPFVSAEGGITEIAVGPPNGYHILTFGRSAGAATDLLIAPADSPQATRPLFETPDDERKPSLSPDGQLLAYVSDYTGRYEVYVRRVPGPAERIQVSTDGGTDPVWTRAGRELIYRSAGWFQTATIATEPELDVVARDSLFADVYATNPAATNFDVFPNGDLAVVKSPSASVQLVGITNWRVPVRK
jgi:hypothetical protein